MLICDLQWTGLSPLAPCLQTVPVTEVTNIDLTKLCPHGLNTVCVHIVWPKIKRQCATSFVEAVTGHKQVQGSETRKEKTSLDPPHLKGKERQSSKQVGEAKNNIRITRIGLRVRN